MSHSVYLSLGSNIGDKRATIERAITLINKQIGTVVRQSAFFESEPWGFDSENMFVNVCICCHTDRSPHDVLAITQAIERDLGRTQKSLNGIYHDRTIDIDILTYDDLRISSPELTIPPPRMHDRDFVMVPLREILVAEKP